LKRIIKNGGSFYTSSECTVIGAIEIRPIVMRICDQYPLRWFTIRLRSWASEETPDNRHPTPDNGVVGCMCALIEVKKGSGTQAKKRHWVIDTPPKVDLFKSLGGSSGGAGGGGGSKIMKRKPSKALLGSSVKK
jgi:hypothetical protein